MQAVLNKDGMLVLAWQTVLALAVMRLRSLEMRQQAGLGHRLTEA